MFATFKPVSLGFLRAIGVPLIRGRWPSDSALSSDAVESTDALLVNQRFVDTVLRGHEPIGRHVTGPFVSGTIAGVVADFKDLQLDAEALAASVCALQASDGVEIHPGRSSNIR